MICRAWGCGSNALDGHELCDPHLEKEEEGRWVRRKPQSKKEVLQEARDLKVKLDAAYPYRIPAKIQHDLAHDAAVSVIRDLIAKKKAIQNERRLARENAQADL